MTVLASKPIVEDSLEIAQSLRRAWTLDDVNDPRLEQLRLIERHLSDLLHAPPGQMAQDGASNIEDYLDDAKQPHIAAQVKQEVDLIARWRRQSRSVIHGNGGVHKLPDPNALSVHPRGNLIECSERDYWGYRNWITGHTALLIDSTESTHNTKRRLALNALQKGIGIDQLAGQFRRMFKKQEDETRKYYEDSVPAAGAESVVLDGRRSDAVATMRPLGECDWRAIARNAAENMETEIRVQDRKRAPEDTKLDNQPPEFRFRLNGEIMPEIFVLRESIHGEAVREWQIAVDIDGIGRFTVDDNSNLRDPALSKFVLEYRDETSWALLPQSERHASVDKGWNRA